ncbi:multiple antibiotic resistance protein [Flavobacterium sp. 103]|uniref:MarC family NAAT transporter n=1 Tax=unclassified Flavobacterium TaxID=196869 RepID=UPI000D5D55E8|nr:MULTISPECIES: MarC family NAAT transporter [unclassified Flavobacterium]PVX46566.1 multiple antibiotic resistance protein [Flavobacterium sp. 103]QKJ64838.1 MarC family NAAT transporter [Flavobacterium sp. M31R6]
MDLFIYLFVALFSVLNPIGTVPIFVGLTQGDSKQECSRISLWTSINVFLILIISFFIGKYVLSFFGISIDSLRIAGGLIIVSSGFSLLSGKFNKKRGINKKIETDAQKRNDIALTPLAIPMLAGPGSISLLIAFYQEHNSTNELIIASLAILAIAIAIFIILRSAHYLAQILGASGIVAISRIVGFIVIAIGIQYIVSALINIIKSNLM